MATTKITELSAHTSPATTDVLPIVDVSEDSTKKIEVTELFKGVGDGTVAAPAIAFAGDSDTGIYRPDADEIAISAGGTNQVTVDSDGVKILDTFTVTTSGSERIRVLPTGGLTFNGDTAAANALDDYEEGTFTPHIVGTTVTGSATYTSRTGVYTKVGNQVSFALEMTWTFVNGIGNMKVQGLPYDSKSGIDQPVSALSDNLNLGQQLNAPALTFHAMVLPNSNEIKLHKCQVSSTAIDDISMDGAATVYLAGTYLASN